jgi:glycosyltransferase involved in cell wall biosynthesis
VPAAGETMKILMIGSDWHWTFQRSQQLGRCLAQRAPVVYWGNSSFWYRKLKEAPSGSGNLRRMVVDRPTRNLTIVTMPKCLPFRMQERFPKLDFALVWAQFAMLTGLPPDGSFDAAILCTYATVDAMIWERASATIKVYDCYDDNIHFFPPGSREARRVARTEDSVFRHADLVMVSTPPLADRAALVNSHVVLIPNGADVEHFARNQEAALPTELRGRSGPVLGFVGVVQTWVDVDLIARLADLLSEYTIVIVGRIECDVSSLTSRTNVILVGSRPYSELPGYVQRFDVCMIPFVDSALTRAVDPVKFYEYSAAGKPVVSTPLPTMQARADLVYLARTPDDFADQVRRARAEDSPQLRRRRQALAAENSWQARADKILDAVAERERALKPVTPG